MSLACPTWPEARKYVKRGLPLTSQAAELYRLANNERREAFRVACKAWLDSTQMATRFPDGLDAQDIPAAIARRYSPVGNIRSQMLDEAGGKHTSGNLAVEIQAAQTYTRRSGGAIEDVPWADYFLYPVLGAFPASVWGKRRAGVDYNGRIYGLREFTAAATWNGDTIGMWCGSSWSNPIYADTDSDWHGDSPPSAGKERPKPKGPLSCRLLTEVWRLLNRLRIVVWPVYRWYTGDTADAKVTEGVGFGSDVSQSVAEDDAEAAHLGNLALSSPGGSQYQGASGHQSVSRSATFDLYLTGIDSVGTRRYAGAFRVPGVSSLAGKLRHLQFCRPEMFSDEAGYTQGGDWDLRFATKSGEPSLADLRSLIGGGSMGGVTTRLADFVADTGGSWELADARTNQVAPPSNTSWVAFYLHNEYRETAIGVVPPEFGAAALSSVQYFFGTPFSLSVPHGVMIELDFDHLDRSVDP